MQAHIACRCIFDTKPCSFTDTQLAVLTTVCLLLQFAHTVLAGMAWQCHAWLSSCFRRQQQVPSSADLRTDAACLSACLPRRWVQQW